MNASYRAHHSVPRRGPHVATREQAERNRDREQPVGFLQEDPDGVSRGLGFIFKMSREAAEGFVPDEGFPKQRVVEGLIQKPWRCHDESGSHYSREAADA